MKARLYLAGPLWERHAHVGSLDKRDIWFWTCAGLIGIHTLRKMSDLTQTQFVVSMADTVTYY